MSSAKQGKGPRVAVTTLGCKVNQFESASFLSGFEEQGAELVPFSQAADIYVINSCAVTAKAGAQSRQMIRRALRANPEARLVVTGCYAQVAAKDILGLADRPICIVGNGNKHHLVEIALASRECDLEMYTGDIGRKKEICPLTARRFAGRTRAYVKVQDGCNRFCSYCIVPYARGRSRSLSPAKVLEQIELFVREGYKEIVLTGIHIGTYGEDLSPAMRLYDLLLLLAKEELPVRYRVSSLEPVEVTKEILGLMAESPCFLPHLHIPLQSGDNNILTKMNRRYTSTEFADIVGMVGRYLPDAAIGADVLVGFPGEDEQAFANTRDLLTDLPVTDRKSVV